MTFPQEWALLLMEAEQAGQKRGAKAERERIVSWLRGTPADAIMGLVGHALPRQQTDDIVEALASAIEADPT